MVYVSEWILFLYAFFFVSAFNLVYVGNMIFIDMPWEESITLTSSFSKSLLIIIGAGIICFIYIKYQIGNKAYKIIKLVIWGILLGLNTLSSILWLCISVDFGLSNDDRIILILSILVSLIVTIQIIYTFRNITK